MLVLVDGERLNTARQATDRTGAEVGLISPDSINRIEIINGAGTLMYGSDALAGTVNIITNETSFSPAKQLLYGFNGFYSSNENGMRGTVTLGGSSPRATFRIQAGAEKYDNYKAGSFDVEDTRPLYANGTLTQADTIDTNFGFNFGAFPDPFNAPFVRTDGEILNSQAEGKFVNASGLVQAWRSPHAARPLSEPPHGRRRLPRLRAAVLLQRHLAAVQQPRQVLGALRSPRDHAVAREPVADRVLPAHRAPAADHAAGAVPGADRRARSSRSRCSASTSCPKPSSASGRPAST